MKNIIAAFQFLTIIPMPVRTSRKNLEKSMAWFPLTGAVIGLITGYGYRLGERLFSAEISAVLTIFLYIVLTRGLHLDGFMDTIDGFFSHKSSGGRAAVLKIMKDPVVGSFAVLGALTWFLLLFSALRRLEPADHIAIHSCTRLGILIVPLLFSYPRESGTGKFFADHVKLKTLGLAMVVTLAPLAAVCFIPGPGEVGAILVRAASVLIAFLVTVLIGLWAKKKISGFTGDTLGFSIEIAHLVLVLLIPLMFNLMAR